MGGRPTSEFANANGPPAVERLEATFGGEARKRVASPHISYILSKLGVENG
jgi:hypothetical protein